MIRELKVCRKWQGSKGVPSISLQGGYLHEHGFAVGDTVRVEVFRDEIRIKKMSAEAILRAMTAQRFDSAQRPYPSLEDLITRFDCVLCD